MTTLQSPPTTASPTAIWNVSCLREHCAQCGAATNHNTYWHDLYGPDEKADA
jgi:hypothetical protein